MSPRHHWIKMQTAVASPTCWRVMCLAHWGRDKMATIFQTKFSSTFSWMKIYEFRLKFHWSLFLMVKLTIFQHWFRYWLDAGQATCYCLSQWWLVYWHTYASLGLNELRLGNPFLQVLSLHMTVMTSEIPRNCFFFINQFLHGNNKKNIMFRITDTLWWKSTGHLSIPLAKNQ